MANFRPKFANENDLQENPVQPKLGSSKRLAINQPFGELTNTIHSTNSSERKHIKTEHGNVRRSSQASPNEAPVYTNSLQFNKDSKRRYGLQQNSKHSETEIPSPKTFQITSSKDLPQIFKGEPIARS